MVRHQAYEQAGSHSAIKMHPIDGLMLGKVIKEDGLLHECLSGYDFFALTVVLRLAFLSQAACHGGLSALLAPAALVTPCITVYTLLKTTFTTLRNNSVLWRDSRYSLDELRRQTVLFCKQLWL